MDQTEEHIKLKAAIEIMTIFNVPTDIQEEIFSLLMDALVIKLRRTLSEKLEAIKTKISATAESSQVTESQQVIDPQYLDSAEQDLTHNKE